MSAHDYFDKRLSILEARIQQELSRPRSDRVRLELLKQMRSSIIEKLGIIERGASIDDDKKSIAAA